jgi:hypothetical protein
MIADLFGVGQFLSGVMLQLYPGGDTAELLITKDSHRQDIMNSELSCDKKWLFLES